MSTHPLRIIVAGGAGFIGSAVVRNLIARYPHRVLVLDALTYAGSRTNLREVENDPRLEFHHGHIQDHELVARLIRDFCPDVIMNLAAESHVDRSIDGPADFIDTNIRGTFVLLEAALVHYRRLKGDAATRFRFHHISTDEVFGSLGTKGRFDESSPYDPRSPYAASKAASDHLVAAWGHTYGLPVLLTNCSNNYGPYQFPEKLIPLIILNALEGAPLPVYGTGANVRDWLHVDDHARALMAVIEQGSPGESYAIGANSERTNIQIVRTICVILDELNPRSDGRSHADRITFVPDRPGHDARYAIAADKIRRQLGWSPQVEFESGLRDTVRWYIDNRWWWAPLRNRVYSGSRLGLSRACGGGFTP